MGNNRLNVLSGIIFIIVAISLPVTIFLVNQPQDIRQQASEPTLPVGAPGCPAVNSDKTTNTCRPQPYCEPGETIKYEGNDMCTTSLGKESFCCTQPKK